MDLLGGKHFIPPTIGKSLIEKPSTDFELNWGGLRRPNTFVIWFWLVEMWKAGIFIGPIFGKISRYFFRFLKKEIFQ